MSDAVRAIDRVEPHGEVTSDLGRLARFLEPAQELAARGPRRDPASRTSDVLNAIDRLAATDLTGPQRELVSSIRAGLEALRCAGGDLPDASSRAT